MATRSTIAMKTATGKVQAIYCHWDGYLDYNGKVLMTHYTDPAKVAEMIALGDLSSLGELIGEPCDFDNRSTQKNEEGQAQCVAYARDRGETGVEPQTFDDVAQWVDGYDGVEYYYLFNGQDWLVNKGGEMSNGFPLFDFIEVKLLEEIVS